MSKGTPHNTPNGALQVNPLRLHILLGGLAGKSDVRGTEEELREYISNPFYAQQIVSILEMMDRYASEMQGQRDPIELIRLQAKLEAVMVVADFPARALVSDKAYPPLEQREELLNYIKERFYGRQRATD
jgi:hypothetical protein